MAFKLIIMGAFDKLKEIIPSETQSKKLHQSKNASAMSESRYTLWLDKDLSTAIQSC